MMRIKSARYVLERLRESLWPVPLLMLLASVALLQATRAADAHIGAGDALQAWWLHSGNGDDARNLLSTLASAIITIAGVVFSITIVVLSLAANQFGSRLVLAHMRDLWTKLALGSFLSTVLFCLLALRLVSGRMDAAQVPHLTVTTGLALGVWCVVVLVFFLHRVARSIVADEVIRRVARQLDEAIDSLPAAREEGAEPAAPAELLPAGFERDSMLLRSDREGYIQEIHYEALAELAARHDVLLRLDVSAGEYMCKQGWLGRVHPGNRCSPGLLQEVRRAVLLGRDRTPVQDLAYPLRHLVDVALRALSPGITDANTALVVIDRVRGALARLLARSLPDGVFRDAQGRCRVLGRRRTHAQVLAQALHPIRDAAARQPRVVVGMLQGLAKLAEHARHREHAEAIAREAALIVEVASLHPTSPSQQRSIEQAHDEVRQKLEQVQRRAPAGPRDGPPMRAGEAASTSHLEHSR